MIATEDAFDLSIRVSRGGLAVGESPLSLGPCLEDALFQAVLTGRIPNDGRMPSVTVVPFCNGSPVGEGVPVTDLLLTGEPAPGASEDTVDPLGRLLGRYDERVFDPQARAALALLRDGPASDEDDLGWCVVASRRSEPASLFSTRVSRNRIPFSSAELPGRLAGSLEIEVASRVEQEIRARVLVSSTVECAGHLVGFLDRDEERGAARLRVIDTIPLEAGRTGASASHFGFAPESFGSVRQRISMRIDGAIPVGWYHSHPPCEACPTTPECPSDTVFFSAADVDVHTQAFAGAFMVALVAGKLADRPASDPGMRLYGWRAGRVVPRDFSLTDGSLTDGSLTDGSATKESVTVTPATHELDAQTAGASREVSRAQNSNRQVNP